MTDLRYALEKYLSMRKGLGHKYEHQTRRLAGFVAFMEKRKARIITTKLAMEWATLPPDRHASWALRLSDVRGFARHVANFDQRTEVPPVGMLPGLKRAKPYVYSDTEIGALLAAALALPPEDGLRRWTYHTLFGLIAVTGMRIANRALSRPRTIFISASSMVAIWRRPANLSRLESLIFSRSMASRSTRSASRSSNDSASTSGCRR